jgi:uncharacterized membrane protein YbhN (UPF0104 family)
MKLQEVRPVNKLADNNAQLSLVGASDEAGSRNYWRVVRTAVRWLATAGLIVWLARSTDWGAVGSTFATALIPWLLVAAAINLASQFASVMRWRLLVRAAGIHATWRKLLVAYLEGMFVNLCLPTTVGGDVMKVVRVGGSQNKTVAAGTVVADRACGLGALFSLLIVGLLMKFHYIGLSGALFVLVALVLLMLGAIRVLAAGVNLTRSSTAQRAWLQSTLEKLSRPLPAVVWQLLAKAPWLRVIAWAFAVQALGVTAVAAAARAVQVDVSLVEILVATTTVSLAAALPLSVAGVGVREASLPLLLAADGVPDARAKALAMTWTAIVVVVGLLGGPAHFYGQRGAFNESEVTEHTAPVAARRLA